MNFRSEVVKGNNGLHCRLLSIFTILCLFFLLPETKANTPVKLNTPLTSGQRVVAGLYDLSHDGTTAVYVVRGDGNDKIYKVEMGGGGSPVLLHTSPQLDIQVKRLEIAPDDNNIAVQMENAAGLNGLYRLPMDEAGERAGISSSTGRSVHFEWSSDGRYLAYRKSSDTAFSDYNLFSVAIPESYETAMINSVQLNITNGSLHSDNQFEITPDNQYVLYVAKEYTESVNNLYRIPLAGGSNPVKLSSNTYYAWAGSTNKGWEGFSLSKNGLKAVYRVWVNGEHVLYSVDVGASGTPPVFLDSDSTVEYIKLSNDGLQVCYFKDWGTSTGSYSMNLYSVPMSGGTSEKLNIERFQINTSYHPSFEILPDSSRVIYVNKMGATPTNRSDVFSVPIAGGERVLVSAYSYRFLVSQNNTKVVCGQSSWMHVISPLGEDSQSLVSGADSIELQEVSADGTRLIWVDFDSDLQQKRLFSAPMTGGGDSAELNGVLVTGGSVSSHQLTDDGVYVVYLADQDTDGVPELYSKSLKVKWSTSRRGVTFAPWDSTGALWRGRWIGGTPDESSEVLIQNEAVCQLDGGAKSVHFLTIQGSNDYDGVLELMSAESITTPAGLTVKSRGILKGDGEISTANGVLLIESGGQVEVAAGQQLQFNGEGGVLNWGNFKTTGTGVLSGQFSEMTSEGNVVNHSVVDAENAKLHFNGGLKNHATLQMKGGVTVFGAVENVLNSGGAIHIAGQNTFEGDVVNAASFDVQTNGNVIFNGAFKGYGIFTFGGSMVQLNGTVIPGFDGDAQLARMSFNDDVYLRGNAVVEMQIAGTSPVTEHDVLSTGDLLVLSGTLEVQLLGGYYPDAGDRFDLFDASRVSGQFTSIELPTLYPGLYWHDNQILGASPSEWTGELFLGIAPESYEEYVTEYALDGDPQKDSDGDGVPDLLEYVFATTPTLASPDHLLMHLERVNDHDEFSVTIASPGSQDVQLEMQHSTDMETWLTLSTRISDGVWNGSQIPSVTLVNEGLKKYQISIPIENSRCFYRLKATLK